MSNVTAKLTMHAPDNTPEELRTSEIRYRRLFEAARDGILILDAQSRQITDVNPYMVEMLGYSREEFLGRELYEIGLLKDEAATQQVYRELQESGYVRYEDLPLQTKSGRRWEVEFVCNIYDEDDHQVIQCNIRDITERKQAQQALFQSQLQFRRLLDVLPAGAYTCDAAGLITYFNPQAETLWGRAPKLNDSVDRFCGSFKLFAADGSALSHERCWMALALQTREDYVGKEIIIERPDGSRVVALAHAAPLLNESDHVVGAVNILIDITERKLIEQQLRMHSRLLNVIGQAVAVTDRTGIITYWNSFAEKLYGWSSSEALGMNILDAIPPDASQGEAEEIMACLVRGESWSGEFMVRRRDGTTFPAYVTDTPVLDEAGQVVSIIGLSFDISERKQAEEALREQRELLQIIFDHIPVMISFYAVNGDFQLVNREWIRVLGYSLEEMRSHPDIIAELYPDPEERRRVIGFMRQPSGEWSDFKTRAGDGRILDTSWTNVRLPDGRRIGIGQDITERKRAEAARREADEKFRMLFNAIDEGFCIIEMLFDENQKPIDYLFLDVNPSFEKQSGIKDAQGRRMRDIAPQHEDFWFETYGRVASTGEPVRFENFAAALDRWFDVYAFPVADSLEPRVGLIFADVTRRKQIEEKLRQSQAQLAAAQTLAHVGSWEWDLGTDKVFWSDEMYRILGHSPQQFQATFEASINSVHPEDREEVYRSIEESLREKGVIDRDHRIVRSDGTVRIVNTRREVLVDDSGQPVKMLGSMQDVTEIRQATAEAQAAKAEAERANLAKSEFLSRMSHELRTPLNAILGFGQLLELDALNDEQQESVEQILKGGRHLLDLINEVLDIARIEAGQMHISPEPVSIAEVVRETLELIRPLAAASGISLHDEVSPSCLFHVRADRQRLRQVLLNLLANAVKYNSEGGAVTLHYRHSIRNEAEGQEPESGDRRQEDGGRRQTGEEPDYNEKSAPTLCLEITDTGPGIPSHSMSRLFTPFERLGAEHSTIEGTGVGLALSKRLVELMEGRITAQSTLGQGSTFTVEMLLVESPLDTSLTDLDTPDHYTAATSQDASPTVHTVLYIEDNLPNLRLVESILSRRPNIKLLSATHGLSGLELAREHHPDLILLDLHLPDIYGDEVLRHLRADAATHEIAVVMLSADATPGQIERLMQSGATAYLTKPLDVKQFMAVLDENLSGYEYEVSINSHVGHAGFDRA